MVFTHDSTWTGAGVIFRHDERTLPEPRQDEPVLSPSMTARGPEDWKVFGDLPARWLCAEEESEEEEDEFDYFDDEEEEEDEADEEDEFDDDEFDDEEEDDEEEDEEEL